MKTKRCILQNVIKLCILFPTQMSHLSDPHNKNINRDTQSIYGIGYSVPVIHLSLGLDKKSYDLSAVLQQNHNENHRAIEIFFALMHVNKRNTHCYIFGTSQIKINE